MISNADEIGSALADAIATPTRSSTLLADPADTMRHPTYFFSLRAGIVPACPKCGRWAAFRHHRKNDGALVYCDDGRVTRWICEG